LLDVREGLEILSNTLGRKGIKNGILVLFNSKNKVNTNKIDPNAIALVKELDGLPLALSTVGVYLEHVTTSVTDYLCLCKTSWLKI
jgi:hypothetical protein